VPQDKLSGTIQNDILKEFMVPQHLHLPARTLDAHRGRYQSSTPRTTCPSSTRSRSPAITCRRPARRLFKSWHLLLQMDLEYVRAAKAKGLDIDAFAPRLSFLFCIGMNTSSWRWPSSAPARFLWAELIKPFEPRRPIRCRCAPTARPRALSLTEQDPLQQRDPHRLRGDGGGAGRHRSRSTPIPSTRRSRCRRRHRHASRATRS